MNARELALHYLRYYSAPGQLAANAPEDWARFVRGLPDSYDRGSVHNALAGLAGRPQVAPVDPAVVWISTRPDAWKCCDEILASKKPPKTWDELITRAYNSAHQDIINAVRKFLKDRIESF
jgi:hypothetical protein